MHISNRSSVRRGAVLPLVAVSLLAVFGFVALAVDLGMIMVARNHCQNAADSAALTGVRTINGDAANDFRIPEMPKNVYEAASRNPVIGDLINVNPGDYDPSGYTAGDWQWANGDVDVELGSYTYVYSADPAQEGFKLRFPRAGDEPYGAVRTRVGFNAGRFSFARIWGLNSFSTGATATAVHRPRDIMVVMDLSGSMGQHSQVGTTVQIADDPATTDTDETIIKNNLRDRPRDVSLNPDPAFPRFGQYSHQEGGEYVARLFGDKGYFTDWREQVTPGNTVVEFEGNPPLVEFYWEDAAASLPAFTGRRNPTGYDFAPGGDAPPRGNKDQAGEAYAATARAVLGLPAKDPAEDYGDEQEYPENRADADWEAEGYKSMRGDDNSGYTLGPNYWGKTFFMWPPDPRGAAVAVGASDTDNGAEDWRQRFFMKVPIADPFGGTVEPPFGFGSSDYPAGHAGPVRVRDIDSGQTPRPGDTVSFPGDPARRLYTVVGVSRSTVIGEEGNPRIKEVLLDRPLDEAAGGAAVTFRVPGWVDDNRLLFLPDGGLRAPGPFTENRQLNLGNPVQRNTVVIGETHYFLRVNYAAIFRWLRSDGANPFPPSLRAGGIVYYTSIPDPDDGSLNDRFWRNSGLSKSERFWRGYVDMVLGFEWEQWRDSGVNGERYERYGRHYRNNAGNAPISSLYGSGDLFAWGPVRVTAKPTAQDADPFMVQAAALPAAAGTDQISFTAMPAEPAAGDIVTIQNDDTAYRVVGTADSAGLKVVTVAPALASSVEAGERASFKQLTSMDYDDSPRRPRHQYWFGALTMMEYIDNIPLGYNRIPGSVPEAQSWACKMGIQAAMKDVQNNHPNDTMGLVFFSTPRRRDSQSQNPSGGQHNMAKVALRPVNDPGHLGRLTNSLWFPESIVNGGGEFWYDDGAKMAGVPRAGGGTAPQFGLRLAYNQFSSSTDFNALRYYHKDAGSNPNAVGLAGGMGRKGAQKIVILETDGVPKDGGYADFQYNAPGPLGENRSYYKVRVYDHTNWRNNRNELATRQGWQEPNDPAPGDDVGDPDVYSVVRAICNPTDHPSRPGFSTTRRPALVHVICYGALFAPVSAGEFQDRGLSIAQTIQYYGNTADSKARENFPPYKQIYGDVDQKIAKMREAFTTIMQEGVTVSLIE